MQCKIHRTHRRETLILTLISQLHESERIIHMFPGEITWETITGDIFGARQN